MRRAARVFSVFLSGPSCPLGISAASKASETTETAMETLMAQDLCAREARLEVEGALARVRPKRKCRDYADPLYDGGDFCNPLAQFPRRCQLLFIDPR
jgi:hypothetical protein